jgi:nitrogen-specific signal transduction histidine kinase
MTNQLSDAALALFKQLPQCCWLVDAEGTILASSVGLHARCPQIHWHMTKLQSWIDDARLAPAMREALRLDQPHTLHDVVLRDGALAQTLSNLSATPVHAMAPARLLLSAQFRDTQTAAPELLAREMARALAHEIRNPLGGLRGVSQLLQAKLPDYAEYTALLISECDRLAELVQRLLHERPTPLDSHNVHGPIERAMALITHEFPSSVQLQRDFDPSLPDVALDADALTQAVLNLLRNAVEARASRIKLSTRVQHRVELGGQLLKSAVRIDVEDDGHGVPEHLRDRLFLPLVTGKSAGTGFGLATTLAIAERHRGGLRFSSQPQKTIFSLYLSF